MMATTTKTVLLIYGDPNIQEVMQAYLSDFGGWNVLSTQHPLTVFISAAQNQPDAILFDLSTYDMTFLTFLQHLRSQPATQDIPVILLAFGMKWFNFDLPPELQVAGVINDNRSADLLQQIATLLNWDC